MTEFRNAYSTDIGTASALVTALQHKIKATSEELDEALREEWNIRIRAYAYRMTAKFGEDFDKVRFETKTLIVGQAGDEARRNSARWSGGQLSTTNLIEAITREVALEVATYGMAVFHSDTEDMIRESYDRAIKDGVAGTLTEPV